MVGLIEVVEGERLYETAKAVSKSNAIVEIGSHRGLSSCWLASGSMEGLNARVTCVDTWPAYDPVNLQSPDSTVGWQEEGALEQHVFNIKSIGAEHMVTRLRMTAVEAAASWTEPIEFLFHDAEHAGDAVARDYLAWLPFLIDGAWVAVHDYNDSKWDKKTKSWKRIGTHISAVDRPILSGGQWTDVEVVGNMWIGRRVCGL